MFKLDKLKQYSPAITRISLSLVFLWFGVNQLFDAEKFMGYLPEFLLSSSYASSLVIFNGIFEVLAGVLLLVGKFIRPVSLVLAGHLFFIILSLGYNDIAVRDFGLMLITISTFIGGKDIWSLDYLKKKV